MPKVSNLKLELQGEATTSNTLVARWDFTTSQSSSSGSTTTNKVKVGNTVTIKSGSKYYNGASIPSWVMNDKWIVSQVSGDRAVINKNTSGTKAINSPIKTTNLTIVKSSSQSTSTTAANTLDYYSVKWYYASGNGIWFDGEPFKKVVVKHDLYTIPDNATKVKVIVKPVAKKYKSGKKEVSYWTGTSVSKEYITSEMPPDQLSAPTVTIDKYTLKASIENIEDAKCEEVQFEVYRENSKFSTSNQSVQTARASYSCSVNAGYKYRVRCRGVNLVGKTKVYGAWSNYSAEVSSIPSAPTNLFATVNSDKSVRLDWTGSNTATGYTVEYTTNKLYFDSSSDVSSVNVTNVYAYLNSLEVGKTWYFRVKATIGELSSEWSEIVSTVIGTKPQPPTTWSLTTSAIIGETITLYWVHNSEDGSKQTQANIELLINGNASIITIDTAVSEDDKLDKVYSYTVDLSEYETGAEILWRVRTRGITYEYSDWSIQRTINVYAPPTVEMHLGDDSGTLTEFPYTISAVAGPNTQTAITYHIAIKATETYVTQDEFGEDITVNEGSEVYSKVFTVMANEFTHDLTPEEITLENDQRYEVDLIVSMNSGLTAEAKSDFVVSWSEDTYEPDASVVIDRDTMCAYIMPYCLNEDNELIENLVLSVLRREYNGGFTKIMDNIENDGSMTVTDPHPSLDYARYRIVSRNINTSVYSYIDLPGEVVEETAVIIQWDQKWSNFDYKPEADEIEEVPNTTGSMLRLPYNIDTSENYDLDKSLVEYIGRKHPVSYYGTQQGVTATWNVDIPKSDKETIYALRRLASWDGDVYVREPNGVGYKANVVVSMSIKHKELKIPVTLSITRVESDEP